ncbi:MAG TPA: sigma-54 dependent transcriptional regulator [Puia sp.]|uniref:sigma-54 interaction domain-containing protein n=1 Tax=Puia sp. TaxID=2045100 RepID=UPI002C601BDD|nr:sigma-54 dependent transcriptional regulator [Puia sp.]HVU96390.1 sigma-54 dependent transcriptional regulator [Puia sp.]
MNNHLDIAAGAASGLIGKSPAFAEVLHQVKMVAPFDTTVLLLGESGTGKERIATLLHELSPRADKPVIKVNCAALPPTLVESVLFGHERGSFTGAIERRIGKFEQAQGGTLVLDEIGELSPDMQMKFLRALQEREIERIGCNRSLAIDVRVVAATNKDLAVEVAEARFRVDLYYRLNAFPVILPPLRERREDIPALTRHFVRLYGERMGKPDMDIAPSAMHQLLAHDWPGNIRELEHVIERSLILCPGCSLDRVSIHCGSAAKHNQPNRLKTIEENERDHVLSVLKICKGKISGPGGAAELLQMKPSTLFSRMKKMGIGLSREPLKA